MELHQVAAAERTSRTFGKPPGLKSRRSDARDELRRFGLIETEEADRERFGAVGIRIEDLTRDVLTEKGRLVARVLESDVMRARRTKADEPGGDPDSPRVS